MGMVEVAAFWSPGYALARDPIIDASVVVALLSILGGVLFTVAGVAVARILTTNKEEMTRLQGVEDKFRILEDYVHRVRDWGVDMRTAMIQAGLTPPEPVPPWPAELRGNYGGHPAKE